MKRRQVLKLGCAALTTAAKSPAGCMPRPTSGPRFLLVFLRGGYDSINLLVPYSSSFYYESRPTIAIARPDAASSSGALALNADWALAPAVRDTIGSLYQQRQAAFVPFAGTDDLSRSHFETQDSIELGQPSSSTRDYRSGFLGRLAGTLAGPRGRTHRLHRCPAARLRRLRAPCRISRSRTSANRPSMSGRRRFSTTCTPITICDTAVREGLDLRQEVAQKMAEEMNAANRSAINTKGFELEAERMGTLDARQVPHRLHRRRRLGHPRR